MLRIIKISFSWAASWKITWWMFRGRKSDVLADQEKWKWSASWCDSTGLALEQILSLDCLWFSKSKSKMLPLLCEGASLAEQKSCLSAVRLMYILCNGKKKDWIMSMSILFVLRGSIGLVAYIKAEMLWTITDMWLSLCLCPPLYFHIQLTLMTFSEAHHHIIHHHKNHKIAVLLWGKIAVYHCGH